MMQEDQIVKNIQKAMIGVTTRAERAEDSVLQQTFVDAAPLFDMLSTKNNQVIFGRRGTGKTHALKFLAANIREKGDIPVYIDLRSVGSNGSIYADGRLSLPERATTLINDVFSAIHDSLVDIVLSALDHVSNPGKLSDAFSAFADQITSLRVVGETEEEVSGEAARTQKTNTGAQLGKEVSFSTVSNDETFDKSGARRRRSGHEAPHLVFGGVQDALTILIDQLGTTRLWLLLDEWSEIPVDLQPYLADLFRRTVFPNAKVTVKIAAIEHRTYFTIHRERGEYIGIELGADAAADLNLDDFMVFENDKVKATEFFKSLVFRHFVSLSGDVGNNAPRTPDQFMQTLFTQYTAFEEFVRASEGVPRDAIYLLSVVCQSAFGRKVSMPDIRKGAQTWYQRDKSVLLRTSPELDDLLQQVITEVIGRRRARAFLFRADNRNNSIDRLFDGRLLHILKRNVSSHDDPGVRYDVYKLDYGCYVDLITTTHAPQGLLPDEVDPSGYVEVPPDDWRSIRRAILTL